MRLILAMSFILLSLNVTAEEFAETKMIGVNYFSKIYGHVHKNPFRYSLSLTTISCGHPVKVLKAKAKGSKRYQDIFSKEWRYVKVGPYKGYIHIDYISNRRPRCFQDKYPKFYNSLNLAISDMYFWGKLYDQYLSGKSKVR
jgi:hypothetical protein